MEKSRKTENAADIFCVRICAVQNVQTLHGATMLFNCQIFTQPVAVDATGRSTIDYRRLERKLARLTFAVSVLPDGASANNVLRLPPIEVGPVDGDMDRGAQSVEPRELCGVFIECAVKDTYETWVAATILVIIRLKSELGRFRVQ